MDDLKRCSWQILSDSNIMTTYHDAGEGTS